MFKKILPLLVVVLTVGFAAQTQAQSVTVTIGGSATGAPLSATATTPVAPLCFGGTSSVTVTPAGGTGAYSYTVDGGTAVPSITAAFTLSLTSGAHSVVVSNGDATCTPVTVSITVPAAPAQLTASFTPATVQIACGATTASSGTVTVAGGTPAYTYAWTVGTGTAAVPSGNAATSAPALTAGTYNVAVSDANGCATSPALTTVTITAPNSTLAATVTATQILCNTATPGGTGSTTGSIAVTNVVDGSANAVTMATYTWTGGTATQTATESGLAAGTYTVVVSKTGYCPSPAYSRVINPAPVATSADASSVTADGCQLNAGSVILTGKGGLTGATYEVKWTTATLNPATPARPTAVGSPTSGTYQASPATFTGLTGGYDYKFVIRDSNGCITP